MAQRGIAFAGRDVSVHRLRVVSQPHSPICSVNQRSSLSARSSAMRTLIPLFTWGVAALVQVHAFQRFTDKIPNGCEVPNIKALGHVNHVGGGALNAFGRAFAAAGRRWTTELCQADTDNDGQTNGQELGDPCCSWVETQNLAYIRGISDPNDPTSVVNPMIFRGIQCTKSEDAIEANSKKTNKPKTPKPTTAAPVDNAWDDFYGSASGSGSNMTMPGRQRVSKSPSSASPDRTSTRTTITASAIVLGLAITWALF